ncbi:thiamine pyrophosphate-binding protein [Aurantimonas sp. VKM B-3413]|uniref:thiamine pyrophosphate-binding protein n=1 Tax=Aurantimonas sp. VKM B-3413 TaxID=2779401 RepID=UPI001E5FF554|nr:thiamine pyrophosphate-binding protein [Aurantimonas sp. VKM B-3413]MCB8836250.1 thiamine pyrophosphate-binding protein [Aurantimonas sp. VKM B-3413]
MLTRADRKSGIRGADLLVRILAAAGVRRIFSLSGNQIMPVYDACLDAGIQIIHTRHEAAAVFMADAHAQLTGTIGVALVTAAPGALNAVGPLYSARCSESPVLLLTGDSAVAQDGMGAFQELDQIAVTAPLTKLSRRPSSPAELSRDLIAAMRTAVSGRPGPVHLALPFDMLEADAGAVPPPETAMPAPRRAAAPDAELSGLQAKIAAASRPLIIAAPCLAATRSGPLTQSLADALDAPVLVMESPRGTRDPSLGALSQIIAEADLIVSLGKRIDFTLGFGRLAVESDWVFVDPEDQEHERARRNLGSRLVAAIRADAGAVAEALVGSAGQGRARTAWRDLVARNLAARQGDRRELPRGDRITSAALCAAVQAHISAADESVVICDGGEFGQWAQAGTHGTYRLINGPSGAIGGSPCYALAAKLARPHAQVFALMGDGTIGFHLAEFETAARENAPFVAIVGNDRCWNAEHQIQLREYGPDRLIGCQLSEARYDKAVEALGGHGEFVTRRSELDAAIARAVGSGKVACVNVLIEGQAAPSGAAH